MYTYRSREVPIPISVVKAHFQHLKWNFNLKIYISVLKLQYQPSDLNFSFEIAISPSQSTFFQYYNCNFIIRIGISILLFTIVISKFGSEFQFYNQDFKILIASLTFPA